MKTVYYITIAILFTSLISCKTTNKNYTINGTIIHKDIDSIFLYDFATEKVIDSILVKDGNFTLTGTVKEPKKIILGNFDKNLIINAILDNDNYNIVVGSEKVNITGGKVHNIIYGFYQTEEYKKLNGRYEKAMSLAINNTDPQKTKELEAKAEELGEELFQYECAEYRKVIEGNYPTNLKLFALSSTYDWGNYPIEKQLKILDTYEKELGETPLIKNHRAYLKAPLVLPNQDNRVVPNVGETYKDVIALDINGKPHKLSDVLAKNKYVILEFWASWCMPCKAEIPNLKKAYQKYKSKGLEIFSVSLDEKKENWTEALKGENTSWINLFGENEFNSICAFDYGVTAIPSSFLISKEGKIVAKDTELRGGMLDAKLAEFLK